MGLESEPLSRLRTESLVVDVDAEELVCRKEKGMSLPYPSQRHESAAKKAILQDKLCKRTNLAGPTCSIGSVRCLGQLYYYYYYSLLDVV